MSGDGCGDLPSSEEAASGAKSSDFMSGASAIDFGDSSLPLGIGVCSFCVSVSNIFEGKHSTRGVSNNSGKTPVAHAETVANVMRYTVKGRGYEVRNLGTRGLRNRGPFLAELEWMNANR